LESKINLKDIHHNTIDVYERHAKAWDEYRPNIFFEKSWLDIFISYLPSHASILDVGCGAGRPIAEYLLKNRFSVTGLDASKAMLEIARERYPESNWIFADMRHMKLEQRFDGIISWDGFFHLSQQEQRAQFATFDAHLKNAGVLMLTIGDKAGEVTGMVEGEKVYHSSLSIEEYREILGSLGFHIKHLKLKDPECDYHSVLLAQKHV